AGHRTWVRALAFAAREKLLFSADYAGRVHVWPLESDSPVPRATIEAHKGWVRALAVSPDGRLLASCGNDNLVRLWSVPDGKPLVVLFDWQTGKHKQLLRPRENFQGTAWGVAFHPSGAVVGAGGGSGGALWFWKPDAAPSFFTLKLPANARDLDLHPDGRRL